MNNSVTVIGASLAGSEAALTLAEHGFKVTLYEMKPTERSPRHTALIRSANWFVIIPFAVLTGKRRLICYLKSSFIWEAVWYLL
jgi:flavin-dependent dehydrogenase